MTTRANRAADKRLPKAVENVASAATNHTVDTDSPAVQQSERPPLADAKPLLLRLEHSVIFANDDSLTLQPKIGATCKVGNSELGRHSEGTETVWLSAPVWQGIATIIRQTPDMQRANVAAFLEIVAFSLTTSIAGVLHEMVDEVKSDPY